MREQRAAAYAVAAAVYVALVAWAPIAAFHKPIGLLLFALLFGLGTELLRRQTLREFPAAATPAPTASAKAAVVMLVLMGAL